MDAIATQIDSVFGTLIGWMVAVMFWEIPGLGMPLVVAWLLFGAVFFTLQMQWVHSLTGTRIACYFLVSQIANISIDLVPVSAVAQRRTG